MARPPPPFGQCSDSPNTESGERLADLIFCQLKHDTTKLKAELLIRLL